ncbi:MAG: glycoside hydrolase family 43 protein [Actinomycetota bacterium]|nr:glycoside hydrolase family 43 protein [Actinomycetota bacterium]
MRAATYTNPVYDGYFADPAVVRVDDEYWAYGTGSAPGGRPLQVLRSADLVHWEPVGGALEPLTTSGAQDYWAPEVVEHDGTFYLYYSVGVGDRGHRLRVATADDPAGPFVDSGRLLAPSERFAIDPHPFRDRDGQWYLYYARDVLSGERVGTALAVDRLVDMTTLAGDPSCVLRASADWQLFEAQRTLYGGVYDWYTLEGPFVVERAGRYYCFYSAGCWQSSGYGVSYAVADHPLGPFTEPVSAGPAVLRTVPGVVIGPGHNVVVTADDGSDYLVYHAWDPGGTVRRMCIDRLEWDDDGPCAATPTATPQPVPVVRAGATQR